MHFQLFYLFHANIKLSGDVFPLGDLRLRWLPRVSTKVTIRTGKSYKRNPSSVVLQSLFLRFASKVTNIITLILQFLLLRHRPLSWQQNV